MNLNEEEKEKSISIAVKKPWRTTREEKNMGYSAAIFNQYADSTGAIPQPKVRPVLGLINAVTAANLT